MNWTKTPPTKPGVYLFQPKYGKPEAVLLYQNEHDHRLYQEGQKYSADSWDGTWSGPLVPAEEVRKAYYEGHIHAISSDPDMDPQEHSWPNSRARKVVEGQQV